MPQRLHFACSIWQLKYVARTYCWAGKPLHNRRFVRLMAFVCIGNQFVIERWPWQAGAARVDRRCAQLCFDAMTFQGLLLWCLLAPQRFACLIKGKKIVILSLRVFEIAALSLKEKRGGKNNQNYRAVLPPSEMSVRRCHDFRMDIDWKMMGKTMSE